MATHNAYINTMLDAGFTKRECREFIKAHSSKGNPLDIGKIFNSIPFQNLMETRREWWKNVLAPVELGGEGMTYDEGLKAIKNHYKNADRGIKDFWIFLKREYKPKSRIATKEAFTQAISTKSNLKKELFGISKTRRNPLNSVRCRRCHGVGSVENIEHQQTTCLRCGGSGREIDRNFKI